MYQYDTIDSFIHDFHKELISFPYKKLYYKKKDIQAIFNRLSNFDIYSRITDQSFYIKNIILKRYFLLYEGSTYQLIINLDSDYLDYNILSDMFIEFCRINCSVGNYDSPWNFYHNNINIVSQTALRNYNTITPYSLRESLWTLTKECTSFRPVLLVGIIKMFNCKSVLDFSAGWGDRLLASMSMNVRYLGIDPSPCNQKYYKDMINFFNRSHDKYRVEQYPFEEYTFSKKDIDLGFDLVFTSPPYFDLEIYSTTKNNQQSIENFKNEDEWTDKFLLKSIFKSWSVLHKNGHLVLIINQKNKHQQYIQKMLNFIYSKIPDSQYLGMISYANENKKNPQPMFIWKKTNKIPTQIYNPELYIVNYKIPQKDNVIHVIRDDIIFGGTKVRGCVDFFNHLDYDEFIYASPTNGLAQVALAQSAYLTRKKIILFVKENKYLTNQTKNALQFTNNVTIYFIKNANMKILFQHALEYHNKHPKTSYLLRLGFSNKSYTSFLEKNIKLSIPNKLKLNPPKRLWCVAGSATLLHVLYKVFPKTHFCVVQVGKTIWDDQIEKDRTTLYISDENFYDNALIQPPFPTVRSYDAKLWVFVLKHGQPHDFIWNVGKE